MDFSLSRNLRNHVSAIWAGLSVIQAEIRDGLKSLLWVSAWSIGDSGDVLFSKKDFILHSQGFLDPLSKT